jgi:PHD/YefM family antitoxin component YafN of YafNO toxin-antitoxin module
MTATTLNMSDLRSNLASALDQASEGDVVVVKRRGRRDTSLIDSEYLEDLIAANNPRLTKIVSEARADKNTHSFNEIFADVL